MLAFLNRFQLLCLALCLGALTLLARPAYADALIAQADLIANSGNAIGTVEVEQGHKGVLVKIQAKDLPPGYHGMHFHAVGDCSDLAAFKSAGGHVNPFDQPHGFRNPDGPHEGNLPNLVVAADGTVDVELYSDLVALDAGAAKLLDDDGTALIIHTDKDDHYSQPIGGSGGRIACAVIK
ncbi:MULTISPECIES: superoxide dismutase family protein [Cyanophyceae]|uniref:superoxide dismutase family protein n=1 Tax=Cyanophyceae TaxID=3028117 RepID=UPI0016887CBF|nr:MULTISPECIES: superoxide dismutase family protein [Cyanophyceae]MBD1917984.1 superoxide dismutase family protein [Phormidium sp. FACHB-77]MBD2029232.1 superoxide dismutase family protein [Phormidium sp. FACHB-322]MBD2049764.1 superoxide dismutase family protein [Leptolyngbya sp. FACHB-60]